MSKMKYWFVNVVETCLRMLPIPTRTGLITLGKPDRHAPVILTCNFHLTVTRVKRALKGLNAYLLVANSRGVNVWCAATGGLLTNHDVVSVLKTSGIEDRVDHRTVILPQLAATGIERKLIRKKTGWRGVWGPVYAEDLPEFLRRRQKATPEMHQVTFPLLQRFEMAVAWAFPISLVMGIILWFLWRSAVLPVMALIWGLSFFIFLTFPFYARWLNPRAERRKFIFIDFGKGGFQLILWILLMAGMVAYGQAGGSGSWSLYWREGVVSLVVVLLLSMDLMGSTPVYKSGLHFDRLLDVVLDESKCKGAAFCEQVCPRGCYEVDHAEHLAHRIQGDLCVQCGACIVQCPFDALQFESPDGRVITPETVRKFKLNLMGQRLVET